MSCPRCGSDLVAKARYCHQCGERVAGGGTLQLDEGQIADRASRWRRLLWICGGLILFVSLLWMTSGWWLGIDQPAPARPASAPVAKAKEPLQHYFAVRTTKLRSSKTTEADNIVRTVGRGEAVDGLVETGLDGTTLWLNTGNNGPYVATMNLAEKAPPPLDLALDLPFETDRDVTLYTHPGDDTEGFSLATVAEGSTLHISGVVGNWFEVTLRQGGVGYFKPDSKAEKRIMAKAMAVIDKSEDDGG